MKLIICAFLIITLGGCVKDKVANQLPVIIDETEATITTSQFVWDFSKPKTYIYSFEQTTEGENKRYKDGPSEKMKMSGKGKLLVEIKDKNLADLSLSEVEMKMELFNQNGSSLNEKSAILPTKTVKNMRPNGRLEEKDYDVLFDILLPMPSKNLNKGEKDSILLKMPFNPNNSELFVNGYNTFEFVGFEVFNKRNCAVLKGVIDVSSFDPQLGLSPESKSATTGTATYYFDIENQYYMGADIYLNMDVMMVPPKNSPNFSTNYLLMKNESTYKIRLKRII